MKTKKRFRLMPNIKNPKENIKTIKWLPSNSTSVRLFESYFTHVMEDGEVKIIKIPRLIGEFKHKCINGFYGTSDGYFISTENCDGYYFNRDGDIRPYYVDSICYEDGVEVRKDIVYYERINLFDIQEKYEIEYEIEKKEGYIHIHNKNIRLVEVEPLWKDGDDKQKIIDLYSNVDIDKNIEKFKSNPDIVLCDDADKLAQENLKKIRRKEFVRENSDKILDFIQDVGLDSHTIEKIKNYIK